jgi:Bacterial type II and III secretion system protein/Bacterial type II/III secretion system short domain
MIIRFNSAAVVNLLSAVLLVLPLLGFAGEQVLEVIHLSHRQASEMASIIRPFLGPGETVVAHGTRLIVKAGPQKMAEIRRLINQLDTQLARLQISVIQSDRATIDELNARATIHGGISSRGGRIHGEGTLDRSNARLDEHISQQIQTLEGKAAHIQVGEAFPLPDYRVSPYGSRYYPNAGVTYHEATTGFAVVPRLVGDDEVQLEISPWSDRLRRSGRGIIDTRSAATTIRAPLGQWVELGGQARRASGDATGLFEKSRRNNRQALKLFIKVDKLN